MEVPLGRREPTRPQIVALDGDERTLRLDLSLQDAELWAVLKEVPEAERLEYVLRSLKVGFLALRDARVIARADYVDKEFQRMRAEFDARLESMFGPQGQVTTRLHAVFGDKGDLDQKMHSFFGPDGRFQRVFDQYLGEKGQLRQSLEESIGEGGDFHRTLDGFFGEQGRLRAELDREFGEEGGRLYRILNPRDETTPLGEFRRTLDERIEKLSRDLLGQMADLRGLLDTKKAQELERQRSSAKGGDYEEVVLRELLALAQRHNDKVHDVHADPGHLSSSKAGDFVVDLDPGATGGLPRSLVLDAKNTPVSFRGKDSIFVVLDESLKNRKAHFAIAVVASGQASDHPPLQFYAPNHIVVTLDEQGDEPVPLMAAYELARSLVVGRSAEKELKLDTNALRERIGAVNRELEKFQALNLNLTGAEKSLKEVRRLSEEIREKIKETLLGLQRDLERTGASAGKDEESSADRGLGRF